MRGIVPEIDGDAHRRMRGATSEAACYNVHACNSGERHIEEQDLLHDQACHLFLPLLSYYLILSIQKKDYPKLTVECTVHRGRHMVLLTVLAISLKRLRSKLGLNAILVLSTALSLGMVVCIPAFSSAVGLEIAREELGWRQEGAEMRPFAVRVHARATPRRPITVADANHSRDWMASLIRRHLRLPLRAVHMMITSPRRHILPLDDGRYTTRALDSASIIYANDVQEHIQVVSGAPFGQGSASQRLPIWVERAYADRLGLGVGEAYGYGDPYGGADQVIPIEIAGFWEAAEGSDLYWYTEPSWHLDSRLLTTREAFEAYLQPALPAGSNYSFWYYILDERAMNLAHASRYLEGLETMAREVSAHLPDGTMDSTPAAALRRGEDRATSLALVLIAFSLPVLVVMLYFVAALSHMLVDLQRQEVATLVSRGMGRTQVLALAFVDALLVLLFALPLGILIGLSLAHLLGYSATFLDFVQRSPLTIHIGLVDWRLIAVVGLCVIVARMAPAWSAAGTSIVMHERLRARRPIAASAARLILLAMLALATSYAYYRLQNIGSLSLVGWRPDDPTHDPLLLLAPTLFLLVAPLIAAELFVILLRPAALIGRFLPSVSAYLGCLDVGRDGARYRGLVYMLILCVSLGIFFASLAKSAEVWLIERRRYQVGSDLRLVLLDEERLEELQGQDTALPSALDVYQLPITDYERLDEIEAAMQVGQYRAVMAADLSLPEARLLAIDRLAFPRVAHYRADYAQVPLGDLMNRLGMHPRGILIPDTIATRLQLAEGEPMLLRLLIDDRTRISFEFVVVGTFSYFPTMFPDQSSILVANLDHLQNETSGLLPYEVWLRLAPDAQSSDALDALRDNLRVVPAEVQDLQQILTRDWQRLERVGIFGMLTVCFLSGTLLTVMGLLVHSVGSTNAKSVYLAVLQALGMTRRSVAATVLGSYATVLFYGLALGSALGVVGARFYGPFFQFTDQREALVPPYLHLMDQQGALWVVLAVLTALISTEVVIYIRLVRSRVFELLRMGVRE
jgi:putative ABC transport system permease protein